MRREKEIMIDDKSVIIYEIRPMDIKKVFEDNIENINEKTSLLDIFNLFLPFCSDMKASDFFDLYPSEMELVLSTFKEVNAFFLKMAIALGIQDYLSQIVLIIRNNLFQSFQAALRDLSAQVTPNAGVTGTVSTKTVSEN
jgi:hypothetical protein